MKYISMIFNYIFLLSILTTKITQVLATKIEPKFCIDCKFYKKEFFSFSEFGKCSKFLFYDDNDYFLVNGKTNWNLDKYYYCSTARKSESMCGKEGQYYEKRK